MGISSVQGWEEEALTPAGRMFVQKEMAQVILFAVGMKHPIDVDALKLAIKDCAMLKHPRFCSLMVRDPKGGREHWRKTQIDLDRHFIIVDDIIEEAAAADIEEADDAVNAYLADMSLSSFHLDETKPLWEIHLLKPHNCIIWRIHHALGDGISLMSMFLTLCRRVDQPDSLPTIPSSSSSSISSSSISPQNRWCRWLHAMASFAIRVWFTIVYILGFIMRSLWVRDPKNPIRSSGDGVELWPRKLATARFRLNDMKFVKRAIPGATINDVLFGVISAGLCRYLDHKWPGSMRHGMHITGVSVINLRKQPGLQELAKLLMAQNPSIRWGNQFGMVVLPLQYLDKRRISSPLEHVSKAKAMLDRKKSSLEAIFSYWIGTLVMSWFGPKATCYLNRRVVCNTTFTISNVIGPQEEVQLLAGNPITYIRANVTSLPTSLTMNMISYAGTAHLQILVAKDIIPDPHFLANCFETALTDIIQSCTTMSSSMDGRSCNII